MNYKTAILWDQFNAEADVAKLLESNGWTRARERGERIDYARPGKTPEEGISANWHTGLRLFYVFTNATAFDADRAYNAAQVFCVLECGGDMRDAARKIKDLGYYTPKHLTITGSIHLEV
jgi:hypothetical protein